MAVRSLALFFAALSAPAVLGSVGAQEPGKLDEMRDTQVFTVPGIQARASIGMRAQTELAFDVSVQRGRARLVQEQETRSMTSSDAALHGRGDAALGVGMGGQAEVAWRSRASLRIAGPAELEWSLRSAKGELQIIAGAAGGLELEARRMPVWLELSHGWRLRAREAALQVQELPSGGWSVKHHGGSAVRVLSRVPREEGSWPRVLVAGDEVRLEPRRDEDPPASPRDSLGAS